jgi:hypothetical protein
MVYADTSVYGVVYDDAFLDASARFFNAVRSGAFQLVLSEIVHHYDLFTAGGNRR